MRLTKQEILKMLDAQDDDCAEEIGRAIAQMDSVEEDETWENITQAAIDFYHNDEDYIKDFFIRIEDNIIKL